MNSANSSKMSNGDSSRQASGSTASGNSGKGLAIKDYASEVLLTELMSISDKREVYSLVGGTFLQTSKEELISKLT